MSFWAPPFNPPSGRSLRFGKGTLILHSFARPYLCTYYVPSTILGTEDTAVPFLLFVAFPLFERRGRQCIIRPINEEVLGNERGLSGKVP